MAVKPHLFTQNFTLSDKSKFLIEQISWKKNNAFATGNVYITKYLLLKPAVKCNVLAFEKWIAGHIKKTLFKGMHLI